MNDRAVEVIRTFLTVVGILLLVIFGSRAAAQARNMKLAGASYKSVFAVGTDILNVLGISKAHPAGLYQPQPITSNVPSQIKTATPITSTSTTSTKTTATTQQAGTTTATTATATKVNNGLHKATGTVNNATTKSKQVVNNITKNSSNDFTNLWP